MLFHSGFVGGGVCSQSHAKDSETAAVPNQRMTPTIEGLKAIVTG